MGRHAIKKSIGILLLTLSVIVSNSAFAVRAQSVTAWKNTEAGAARTDGTDLSSGEEGQKGEDPAEERSRKAEEKQKDREEEETADNPADGEDKTGKDPAEGEEDKTGESPAGEEDKTGESPTGEEDKTGEDLTGGEEEKSSGNTAAGGDDRKTGEDLTDPEESNTGEKEKKKDSAEGAQRAGKDEKAPGAQQAGTAEEAVCTDEEIVEEAPDDSILPDSETLFADYLQRSMYGAPARRFRAFRTAGSGLAGINLYVYNALRPGVKEIADGERNSSVFTVTGYHDQLEKTTFTAQELGVEKLYEVTTGADGTEKVSLTSEARAAVRKKIGWDPVTVINALAADCPYEMYWFDKTIGIQHSMSLSVNRTKGTVSVPAASRITLYLPVIRNYASGYVEGGRNTSLNTEVTGAVRRAVCSAEDIVSRAAGLSDPDKLAFYRDEICRLVTYDRNAASSTEYGDPWQIVYVFDLNTDTNVVCEGYAKAFQYLCELTDWEGDVSCISVTGRMGTSTTRTENHMWNVVRVNGMRACLVDVTNCDGGHLGAPDKLYMIRPQITDRNWYCTQNPQVYYSYDSSTLSLFREEDLDVHRHMSAQDGSACDYCGARIYYTVSLSSAWEDQTSLSADLQGAGRYYADEDDEDAAVTAQISAPQVDGAQFKGWCDEQGSVVSADRDYSMTLSDDVRLTAVYTAVSESDPEEEPEESGENKTPAPSPGQKEKPEEENRKQEDPREKDPEKESSQEKEDPKVKEKPEKENPEMEMRAIETQTYTEKSFSQGSDRKEAADSSSTERPGSGSRQRDPGDTGADRSRAGSGTFIDGQDGQEDRSGDSTGTSGGADTGAPDKTGAGEPGAADTAPRESAADKGSPDTESSTIAVTAGTGTGAEKQNEKGGFSLLSLLLPLLLSHSSLHNS